MKKRIGFDFGFGRIKAIDERGKRIDFPSLYRTQENSLDQDLSKFDYYVSINGENFAVGDFAQLSRTAKRWNKNQQLDAENLSVYIGTTLWVLSEDCADLEIDADISVGLPIEHYAAQRDNLIKTLTGFQVEANDKKFTINNVIVSQQGIGAFISLLFDVNGKLRDSTNPDLEIGGGIIDVGYRTTDVAKISFNSQKGYYLNDNGYATFDSLGMRMAYQATTDEINRTFGTSHTVTDIEEALKNSKGEVMILKNRTDIKPIFYRKKLELAKEISGAISSRWPDAEKLGAIYLTGGGAEALDGMINLGEVNILKQENPMFANAEGYLAKLNFKAA